jgi:hypothetical protein
VWGEVWRQLLYVALIVIGAAAGSRFGLAGAAAGVLAATLVVTALMYEWLARIAGLTAKDLFLPQVPACLCAGMITVGVLGTRFALGRALGHAPANGLSLAAESAAALGCYVAFIRFAPFAELRGVVNDTVVEFAPWLRALLGIRPDKGIAAVITK